MSKRLRLTPRTCEENLRWKGFPPVPEASCLICGGEVVPFWGNSVFLCPKCNVRWSRTFMLLHVESMKSIYILMKTELKL
jgi:hypothetical protein